MNTFTNIDDAWLATLRRIYSEGTAFDSRDDRCAEIVGHAFTLDSIDRTWLTVERRKLDPCYAAAEILWYLSGSEDIEMIKAYAPQYARFAENGRAHGAYGKRWADDPAFKYEMQPYTTRTVNPRDAYMNELYLGKLEGIACMTQIAAVISLLRRKPNTRQAVITMWNAGDLLHAISGAHKDLPCTLGLQFLLRDGRLHCVAYMRSNDAWLGLPYDVFAFTVVQRLIACALDAPCGTYTHCVGSMHLYERDTEAAAQSLIEGPRVVDNDFLTWPDTEPGKLISQSISRAVELESIVRCSSNPQAIELESESSLNVVCRDLLELCISKWTKNKPDLSASVLSDAWDLRYAKKE